MQGSGSDPEPQPFNNNPPGNNPPPDNPAYNTQRLDDSSEPDDQTQPSQPHSYPPFQTHADPPQPYQIPPYQSSLDPSSLNPSAPDQAPPDQSSSSTPIPSVWGSQPPGMSDYQPPSYDNPSYTAPNYDTPSYNPPSYNTPATPNPPDYANPPGYSNPPAYTAPGNNPPGYNPPIPAPSGYSPASYPGSYSGTIYQPVNASLVLVMGILGLFVCNCLAPVAWIMGNSALQTIDSGQGDPAQRQLVAVGRILGIIGSVLVILGMLWFMFVLGLGVFGAISTPTPSGGFR